jgi:hypothetical protein
MTEIGKPPLVDGLVDQLFLPIPASPKASNQDDRDRQTT